MSKARIAALGLTAAIVLSVGVIIGAFKFGLAPVSSK